MKKLFKFMIWLTVILYTGFIFSNSLMNGAESSSFSYSVANRLALFLNNHGIYFYMSTFHAYLRKMAHFTEFFGLGALTAIAIATCPLFKSRLLNFILFIIAIPTSDETIQYFVPDRACSIKDVFIDAAGMICGGLCIYILYLIIKDLFFHHKS